jgi:biotin carboxylase
VQLRIAAGATLADLGLAGELAPPRGIAIQARVNMERMEPDGSVRPSSGTLSRFELPAGPGVRVDTFGYGGYTTSASFDSLLAKVIVHAPGGIDAAVRRAVRALREMHIGGVETNAAFLLAVLEHDDFGRGDVTTAWVDEHVGELVAAARTGPGPPSTPVTRSQPSTSSATASARVVPRRRSWWGRPAPRP